MSERAKLTGLLGVVAILLCVGLAYSIRLTVDINHAAQAEQQPAAASAQAHSTPGGKPG